MIEESKLAKEYGGRATAEASCIYSERGPWTEIENKINYKDAVQHVHKVHKEEENKGEFDFKEDQNDQVDLLEGVEGDADEFNYNSGDEPEQDANFDELKDAFKQNEDLKNAFAGLNLPGQTPMNTQIDEDN